METPLVLFTGVPGAGVTTRIAALKVALRHDNGFTGIETDKDGNPAEGGAREHDLEFVDAVVNRAEHAFAPSSAMRRSTTPAPRYFRLTAGAYSTKIQVWERSLLEAERAVEKLVPDGIVISIPVQAEAGTPAEAQLDALLGLIRTKCWSDSDPGKVPWVIFDLTRYETLFSQIVPEMVTANPETGIVTPYAFAVRSEIRRIAVRTFCRLWAGNNEVMRLLAAEWQRCSNPAHASRRLAPRVMIQVSSSWGFLIGKAGPAARHPANCRHPAETVDGLAAPRFPRLTEAQKRAISAYRLRLHAGGVSAVPSEWNEAVEIGQRFLRAWKPVGIVDPLPTVAWSRPAPDMYWAPGLMPERFGG